MSLFYYSNQIEQHFRYSLKEWEEWSTSGETNLVVDGECRLVEFNVNGDEETERSGLRGDTIDLWPDRLRFVEVGKCFESFIGDEVVCAELVMICFWLLNKNGSKRIKKSREEILSKIIINKLDMFIRH